MENKITKIKSKNDLIKYLITINLSNLSSKKDIINISFKLNIVEYTYFKRRSKVIPIKEYEELINFYVYDFKLKELFLSKILFIESSLKSLASTIIVSYLKSDDINKLLELGIESYKNSPKFYNENQRNKLEANYLRIKEIFNQDFKKEKSIISLLKELNFGQFGLLYKSLIPSIREEIRNVLNINYDTDSNKELLGDYIYLLKSLRNACAHNKIIYDTRFKECKDVKERMKINLIKEIKIYRLNFNEIIDYLILITYFLKHFNLKREEIYDFINKFEKITIILYSLISKESLQIIEMKLFKFKITTLKEYVFC